MGVRVLEAIARRMFAFTVPAALTLLDTSGCQSTGVMRNRECREVAQDLVDTLAPTGLQGGVQEPG